MQLLGVPAEVCCDQLDICIGIKELSRIMWKALAIEIHQTTSSTLDVPGV
jgi:hypothetical protein